MMRTLDEGELLYMERCGAETKLCSASYSYINTLLFGFMGWDRYILTEDLVLQGFLESLIRNYCKDVFFQYKIIYVGGGSQVSDLLFRNETEQFLSDPANVIAILDGDQRTFHHTQHNNIHCLPIESVEKALLEYYCEEDFPHRLPAGKNYNGAKDLYHSLQRDQVMSSEKIYSYICGRNEQAIAPLVAVLDEFLSRT